MGCLKVAIFWEKKGPIVALLRHLPYIFPAPNGALFFEKWGRSGFDGDVSGSGCSGVVTFNTKTKETTTVSNLG